MQRGFRIAIMDLRDDSTFWDEASECVWSFLNSVGNVLYWIWASCEVLSCLYWLICGLVWLVGSIVHVVFFVNP